jgi:hypothetical protein
VFESEEDGGGASAGAQEAPHRRAAVEGGGEEWEVKVAARDGEKVVEGEGGRARADRHRGIGNAREGGEDEDGAGQRKLAVGETVTQEVLREMSCEDVCSWLEVLGMDQVCVVCVMLYL